MIQRIWFIETVSTLWEFQKLNDYYHSFYDRIMILQFKHFKNCSLHMLLLVYILYFMYTLKWLYSTDVD